VLVDVGWLDTETALVSVRGDVDQDTVEELNAAVQECLAGSCARVVLDCSEAPYFDSAGISALVLADRMAARRGAVFQLMGVASRLLKLLELTGLDQTLSIADDIPPASAVTAPQTTGMATLTEWFGQAPGGGSTDPESADEPPGSDRLRALIESHEARKLRRRQNLEAARAKLDSARGPVPLID